jgi:hypothetical protein
LTEQNRHDFNNNSHPATNSAFSLLTTIMPQTMPNNATTKPATKVVSKVGPYQVQGGLKGSGSNLSQEKGGKLAGTSNVSRSRSVSQNDGPPNSSSSGSKQHGYGISMQSGKQNSPMYNSTTVDIGMYVCNK